MAIASAVAIVAMSYLAVDAGVVNTGVITKPIEMAQASVVGASMRQFHLAFAVQAEGRDDHQRPPLEHCLAID